MNVINMLVKYQNDKCNFKREILDKTIKEKKKVLKSLFLKINRPDQRTLAIQSRGESRGIADREGHVVPKKNGHPFRHQSRWIAN